jgi:copper chaperone CopZ
VKAVEVDFYTRSATVVYDAEKVQVEQLVEAVNAAGFRASVPAGDPGRR